MFIRISKAGQIWKVANSLFFPFAGASHVKSGRVRGTTGLTQNRISRFYEDPFDFFKKRMLGWARKQRLRVSMTELTG